MGLRVIVTGASGMVGEGVLLTILDQSEVETVLVLGRRPCGVSHSKMREVLHSNFHDISDIESELRGYDACFFCLGVSSVGKNEEKYRHLTYDLTMHVAETLARLNESMTFCYVSGAHTDSTEQGRSMWARVKGKTENDLRKLSFKRSYAFRPEIIQPIPGMNNTLKAYRYLSWLYPLLRRVMPNMTCNVRDIGLAMIHCVTKSVNKDILEVPDIKEVAAL